jgi:hypothetical protein
MQEELAFYYPGHLWHQGEWVKNLLLFFDGIAVLVPEYKWAEVEAMDPIIAAPLSDAGLLRKLSADMAVDEAATKSLIDAMEKLIEKGALNRLDLDSKFHHLSLSRMGWYGAPELAEGLLDKLMQRKLARRSQDGRSVPMHPLVRVLILTLLSQIIRAAALAKGTDLSPATDRPALVSALKEVLSLDVPPSAGGVVAFDLETVGVDLSGVPMDEVLAFRKQHLEQHRAYARSIREFLRELEGIPVSDRPRAFDDRQDEIRDLAADLKKLSRKAWRRPAAFALTIAGAGLGAATGGPLGLAAGLLSGLGAIAGFEAQGAPASAYSYLFTAAEYGQ